MGGRACGGEGHHHCVGRATPRLARVVGELPWRRAIDDGVYSAGAWTAACPVLCACRAFEFSKVRPALQAQRAARPLPDHPPAARWEADGEGRGMRTRRAAGRGRPTPPHGSTRNQRQHLPSRKACHLTSIPLPAFPHPQASTTLLDSRQAQRWGTQWRRAPTAGRRHPAKLPPRIRSATLGRPHPPPSPSP